LIDRSGGGRKGGPGYTLAQNLKKFPARKNQARYRFCPVMTVTEKKKKLIITGFLVKFCFIQN